MIRIVIDTNVFVAAAYNPGSASRKIIQAVRREELRLIVSPSIVQEYEAILPRAVRSAEAQQQAWEVIESAELATPQENPPVTADRADDKFLAAAVAARADAVITSDQHLLAVQPYEGVDILRPNAFWERLSLGGEDRQTGPR